MKHRRKRKRSPDSYQPHHLYSRLADIAYTPLKRRKKHLREERLHTQYDYQPSESNDETAVFRKNGKVVVSFRGTELNRGFRTAVKDIATDLLLVSDKLKHSGRFKDAEKKVKEVIEKYGKDNVVLVGHSLGGTLAGDLAEQYDVEAHTFNRGSTLTNTLSNFIKRIRGQLFPSGTNQRINNYYAEGDPISLLARATAMGRNTIIKPENIENPHTIENFYDAEAAFGE